ncbi:MAG: XRE family transcriptional regulator [Roseobacter sp.]
MQRNLSDEHMTLGADLRALRKTRNLTLADVAGRLGRSVGWLSQVERDISGASIGDLRQIAAVLGVSVSMLFRNEAAPVNEEGYIVRKSARRPLGPGKSGMVEELLSPDLTDDFEVVHSLFEPGSEIEAPVKRATQEVVYLVSGCLDIQIDDASHTINPGDSFRLRGETFRWFNPYTDPAVAIWVIAPPVY